MSLLARRMSLAAKGGGDVPSFSAGSYTAIDFGFPPGDARSTIALQTDGDVFRTRLNSSNGNIGTWITGTFDPADWEARYTNTGGSNPNWGGSDLINTWIGCNFSPVWGCEETGIGNISCTGLVEIRPAGGGAVVTSATYNLSAESTP